jgi:hypothetical protein
MNNLNHQPILKSKVLEKKLSKDGFIQIRSFFNQEELSDLIDFYYENHTSNLYETVYNTVWHSNDIAYKKKALNKITTSFMPSCNMHFKDFKILGGSYVIKNGFGMGESCPHLDFNTIDEDKHRAFSVWVALTKTKKENGALRVVRGSHVFKNKHYRGIGIPNQIMELQEWFWEKSIPIYCNPGDAVIYDHRLVHCSYKNNTKMPRLAVSGVITNSNAQMLLYVMKTNNLIETYELDTDFFVESKDVTSSLNSLNPTNCFNYNSIQFKKNDFPLVNNTAFCQKIPFFLRCI